mmetsp:Transcript_25786/g.83542  ORF Transcript_25786/g.83542 Transcript_25786/m.83542 type:complete len:91 (-) Transcript_25786:1612-1884(-)
MIRGQGDQRDEGIDRPTNVDEVSVGEEFVRGLFFIHEECRCGGGEGGAISLRCADDERIQGMASFPILTSLSRAFATPSMTRMAMAVETK